MPAPTTKESVRRFLGFVQYLSKFLPMLAEVEEPLRELTRDEVLFHWDKPQGKAFKHLKDLCCQAPILAYYDVKKEVVVQCDASKHAIGAVLLQEGRPIAYASRKLRKSELNWAPIEKEMLAVVYSTEKFREYILGKETTIQTDHKPLEAICRKPLMSAPLRLQTMLFKLKGYDLKVEYIPGRTQVLADTLSRASLNETPKEEDELQVSMVERMSVSQTKYVQFQNSTANELYELYTIIQAGWPDSKQEVPHSIRPYWEVRNELATLDGIIYRGMRVVVPPSMRAAMLELIHETHMGIVKSKQRARDTLYWPGMSAQIEEKIANCTLCLTYATTQPQEPLMPTKVPELPWVRVASNLFHFEGENYVLSVDYYSRYIEVSKLEDLLGQETIEALKGHFSRQGIPEVLVTDNGPQYSGAEFAEFAREYNFEHVTTSPRHAQANGEAEAAVKTLKSMWRKCKDKNKALLNYYATPIPSIGLSPSQMNMSRRLRTTLPMVRALLKPRHQSAKDRMIREKERQRYYFDRPGRQELETLKPGDPVRIQPEQGSKQWKAGTVVGHHDTPRSYIVDTGTHKLRRNRVRLRKSTEAFTREHQRKRQYTGPEISLSDSRERTATEVVTPSPSASPNHRPITQQPTRETLMTRTPQMEASSTPLSPTHSGGKVHTKSPLPDPKEENTYTSRSGRSVRRPVKLDL